MISLRNDKDLFVLKNKMEPLQKSLHELHFDEYFDEVYKDPRDFSWQLLEWGSKVTKAVKSIPKSLLGTNKESSNNISDSSTTASVINQSIQQQENEESTKNEKSKKNEEESKNIDDDFEIINDEQSSFISSKQLVQKE